MSQELNTKANLFSVLRAGTALSLLFHTGTGCALGQTDASKPVVKDCVIPTDQASTIAGRWRVTPIPIAFHSGSNWQPDEIADMTAAVDTWNGFYQTTQNKKVLDYGGTSVRMSGQPVPTNVCSQGILQGKTFSGQVVIYKQGHWPHPGGANSTIALTSFCTTPAKPYASTYMAYMEVNYQGFFAQGRNVPDLRTIILHEFGHLLGLYHSCDSNVNKAGTPNCQDATLNPDYHDALMFPVFGYNDDGSGEQKRDLRSNDQGRANCLYPDTSSSTTTSPGGTKP